MAIYNFNLELEKNFGKRLYKFSEEINSKLDIQFSLSSDDNPHITIVKFEVNKEFSKEFEEKLLNTFKNSLKITLSGITFLPSKDGGAWVEISILKSKELIQIQKEFCSLIPDAKIISGIGDEFRPHVTLSRINDIDNLTISKLDYPLLRIKDIEAFPKIKSY